MLFEFTIYPEGTPSERFEMYNLLERAQFPLEGKSPVGFLARL